MTTLYLLFLLNVKIIPHHTGLFKYRYNFQSMKFVILIVDFVVNISEFKVCDKVLRNQLPVKCNF